MDPPRLIPGDGTLIENIVSYLKAKGIFDEFRHECLADVDTKSSCQNLNQRVDGYASKFLATETWNPDMNKNELRNKLRRHIDESGMLAVGADHVVEQVINPKIHTFFLPKIIEVVHQYVREQTELLHKTAQKLIDSSAPAADTSDNSAAKAKSAISDPIADILSFTQSKAKLPVTSSTAQQKQVELKKKKEEEFFGKKKEEESVVKKKDDDPVVEKNSIMESAEVASKNLNSLGATEVKLQCDKEKIKKEIKVEESEAPQEPLKKVGKEEMKAEEKKVEDMKQNTEAVADENKAGLSASSKPSVSNKKEFDKTKYKLKSADSSKVSKSSKDAKKHKKESSEKSSEKHHRHKSSKSSKEPSSPAKNVSLSKSVGKEDKLGSKSKSSDSNSSKASDSSHKKSIKHDSSKKDDLKHKRHAEKSDKHKVPRLPDSVREATSHPESVSTEKEVKMAQYSSSQDSSQGSDQERSSKNEKQKYFSKHTRKESSQKQSNYGTKLSSDKKLSDESFTKRQQRKMERKSKTEQPRDLTTSNDVAKISSRSNSFGSTSSVSSSSNASKDNSVSCSDEVPENSNKDKKKKQQAKEPCHPPTTLLPPPPPPPPSSSFSCKLTSSTEMSSMEETTSSDGSDEISSGEISSDSLSDSDAGTNISLLDALEKKYKASAPISENDFYDIFLYSSSSSDFEGYGSSPEKSDATKVNMDVSISSVHTSDLSSYDDELSDDEFMNAETGSVARKRLTLKRAQQLLQDRAALRLHLCNINKMLLKVKNADLGENSQDTLADAANRSPEQRPSYSSEDESSAPEPKRSLRRERKLNPRYASSEYTSIFNCKKETFITKQASPVKKIQPSPTLELKHKKRCPTDKSPQKSEGSPSSGTQTVPENDSVQKVVQILEVKKNSEDSLAEKCLEPMERKNSLKGSVNQKNMDKIEMKKSSEDSVQKVLMKTEIVEQETMVSNVSEDPKLPKEAVVEKNCKKNNSHKEEQIEMEKKYNNSTLPMSINDTKNLNDSLPLSAMMTMSFDEEQLFKENNKTVMLTENLKMQLKLKPQSNSQFSMNSHAVKRKLKVGDAPPAKRPCSRSSVDSSSSEPAANENKPFNSETQNSLDDKLFRVHDLKMSERGDAVKSELFCKQRTNNNGDILLLTSHGKTISSAEKKAKESSTSKELSAS